MNPYEPPQFQERRSTKQRRAPSNRFFLEMAMLSIVMTLVSALIMPISLSPAAPPLYPYLFGTLTLSSMALVVFALFGGLMVREVPTIALAVLGLVLLMLLAYVFHWMSFQIPASP